MSTPACSHCCDTGSLSKDIEGSLDCGYCMTAIQRAMLENWAVENRLRCDVSALWLIYSKGRDDERKVNGGAI